MGFKLHTWFRRRRSKEEKSTTMVLTVTEDTPADMLTGSMELLVQLPRDHHVHSQRVTVERSTAMMDLLVQIATAHKLAASSYTLQAIGERGVVLPHQPNTPIGALDALQVKLLPKQGTFIPRKAKQPNQPFETTFRLQVHLPRNQLYVSRVSPKMNLGEIIDEVCREKNLDRNKYELRHPGNHQEVLDLSLSLQDYHLQEVTLYAKQGQSLGSALSSQDIMALQRQEERRRQQAKQSVFGFMFRKSKESSLSTDSLGGRSVSPAHSDETGRSVSPLAPPTRPQRKRRPAPNPPVNKTTNNNNDGTKDENKEKLVISHSRNSSDSSGYHEASVLSDNPDSAGRMPETLPRRSKPPGKFETRKLAHTSQTSKSLSNLAVTSASLSHATSNTSLSSTGIRKKRAAPPPPMSRPLSSAISTQALERIVDSEESLTSDMGISKPPSDIGSNSKANSDIAVGSETPEPISKDFYHKSDKENKKVGSEMTEKITDTSESRKSHISEQVDAPEHIVETARVAKRGKLVRCVSSIEHDRHSSRFYSRGDLGKSGRVGETISPMQNNPKMFKKFRKTHPVSGNLFVNYPRGYSFVGNERRISKTFSLRISEDSQVFQSLDLQAVKKIADKENNSKNREKLNFSKIFHPKNPINHLWKSFHRKNMKKNVSPEIFVSENVERRIGDKEFQRNDCQSDCDNLQNSMFSGNFIDKENFLKIPKTVALNHPENLNSSDYSKVGDNCHYQKNGTTNPLKRKNLVNSRSFCGQKCPREEPKRLSMRKMGDFKTIDSCEHPISSIDLFESPGDIASSPPPLSRLQIFAISKKPLDIHVPVLDSLPSDVRELPELPIFGKIDSQDDRATVEKRLSILEPPPPGLVSRKESMENWGRFLNQLNSILENRVEEFV